MKNLLIFQTALIFGGAVCSLLIAPRPAAAQTVLPGAAESARLRGFMAALPRARTLGEEVQTRADAALQQLPQPLRIIHYEGRLDTDPERVATVRHLGDMTILGDLLAAHASSEPEKAALYRAKAVEFAAAWMKVFEPNGNPINENKLSPVLMTYALFRADFGDTAPFDAWIRTLAQRELETGKRRNDQSNWQTKRLALVALAADILDDQNLADYAIAGAKTYVNTGLRADGSSFDFEQRDALSYHTGGVKPLLRLAALLKPAGFDLWSYQAPSGASLKNSVEFMVPYATGEKTHAEFVHSKVLLDKKRAAAGIAEYQPGVLYNPKKALSLFEMAVAFDPKYAELAVKLADSNDAEAATWNLLLARAGWVNETDNL